MIVVQNHNMKTKFLAKSSPLRGTHLGLDALGLLGLE